MPGLVVVTGATGGIGRRVLAALAGRDLELRAVVRDRSRAADLPDIPVAVARYEDDDALREAFDGAGTVVLVSAQESPSRVATHRSAVDAALAAGVGRVVYLSFLGASPTATFTYARDHAATEEHLASSGLRWCSVRPSLYLDHLPAWVASDGMLRGPAGEGRVAWVTRDDVADVLAGVVAEPSSLPDGAGVEVTGPVALTLAESAELLSRVAGRPVGYREETLEEARTARAAGGAPRWQVEGWVTSYLAIAAGELAAVTDAVERIAGHPAADPDRWLEQHPDSWAHLDPGRSDVTD